jgi:hypothetical protein
MAFELKTTVPWGRNLNEYKSMFNLTESDLCKNIVSVGDGPASFNFELTQQNKTIISFDPIYRFSVEEIAKRIDETKDIVIEQIKNNLDNFVWDTIKSVDELKQIRMSAMDCFLQDFEIGKKQGRYVNHEMPNPSYFDDLTFDLGLSSHFLILYAQLGLDFHISSITEMLRIAKEIRIFPLLNLDSKKSELLDDIIKHFESNFIVCIQDVDYEFQKNGTQMLSIKRK